MPSFNFLLPSISTKKIKFYVHFYMLIPRGPFFLYMRKECYFERLFNKRKMMNSSGSILYWFLKCQEMAVASTVVNIYKICRKNSQTS